MSASEQNEGPVVETRPYRRWFGRFSFASGRAATDQPLTIEPPEMEEPPVAEKTLRPTLRAPTPVLTVLDDGSLEDGEDFRIRSEIFVIGRQSGDVALPHDRAVSATHAEIRRIDEQGRVGWRLVDLNASNGTFVRVSTGMIYPATVMMLGCRRFQIVAPHAQLDSHGEGTRTLDALASTPHHWPTLVEKTDRENGLAFPLRQRRITIGRTGGGCDVEIDDPHLANRHATLRQTAPGIWQVKARESVNGTWLSLRRAKLTECCFFRCGEQVFRFVIP